MSDETTGTVAGGTTVGRSIRLAAFVWRVVLLIVCGYGLYLNTGLDDGALDLQSFSYYTILSNLFVLLAYLWVTGRTALALGPDRRELPVLAPVLSGMVLVAITITGLVYNFVLVPRDVALGTFDGGDLADLLVHTWVPLLTVGEWLLFARKGRFRWWYSAVWLVTPAAYAIFAFIRAEVGPVLKGVSSRYPYFFLDADEFGWSTVLVNVLWLLVGFLALGLIVVAVDRMLGVAARHLRR
ncbi:Pr6Pr family membrane protein [Salinibacterium sp. SYSU T00001]|uniref:Pr6Pr family membrane protein n=1 Tax=Homoserinimonas sedimenticola TaxID=2986805 RepID=UPI0022360D97|nr:Pr6Pr family membrane protein [Salinibacterium sedimenticola]MCW4386294.1 Pr6Pr family membrane protein [Salinibacterium sedimenticola]